jgi:hypothetical protein
MKVRNTMPAGKPDEGGGQTSTIPSLLPWISPMIHNLPRLSDLTLQSGTIPGGGDSGGGGSTVVP